MQIKENKKAKSGEFVALSEKMFLQMFFEDSYRCRWFYRLWQTVPCVRSSEGKSSLANSDRGFDTRFPTDEERSRWPAATTVTGIHSSVRYDGARLCRTLYTVRYSWNSMRCGTRSQWRSCRTSDIWSYFVAENDSLQRSWPDEDDWNLAIQRKCSCSSRFSTTLRY